MGQPNQEPSMEDILASIKRIIAEDSEATAVTRPAKGRKGPVAVPDPGPEPAAAADDPAAVDVAPADEPPAAAPPAEPAPPVAEQTHELSDVLELTSPLVEPYEDAPMPAADPAPRDEAPAAPAPAILSSTAETASRNAFAALSQLQVRAETGQANTLEGLVADMLRPMLRDWLDRELPGIVERTVAAEVKRVSGRG